MRAPQSGQPIVPCIADDGFRSRVDTFAELLRTRAHLLTNDLSEADVYDTGLFNAAVERIRGQRSATMSGKREFMTRVLNFLQDRGHIASWVSSGAANRHDYTIGMPSGRTSVIEIKGCLDGNNTNIFTRPPHANEFVIWSLCQNAGADPRLNVRSGIHTRLSAEIMDRGQRVDGLVVWDFVCGTIGRPCPKVAIQGLPTTEVGPWALPPPCLYLFPPTIPAARNNPPPQPNQLGQVEIMAALANAFGTPADDVNHVYFEVGVTGVETTRRTRIVRGGATVADLGPTPIRRE